MSNPDRFGKIKAWVERVLGRHTESQTPATLGQANGWELFDRWRAGDQSAGSELFQRYFYKVYYVFSNKVHGNVDRLVQATFQACRQGHYSVARTVRFEALLYAAARDELHRHLCGGQHPGAVDFAAVSLADLGIAVSVRAYRGERNERLQNALRRLPLQRQLLFELHYWGDMSAEDLATTFGMSRALVKAELASARKALHKHWQTQRPTLSSVLGTTMSGPRMARAASQS